MTVRLTGFDPPPQPQHRTCTYIVNPAFVHSHFFNLTFDGLSPHCALLAFVLMYDISVAPLFFNQQPPERNLANGRDSDEVT